ncbi:ribose 5-phosphate isomerase A [Tanacetum coccineum]
MTILLSKPNLCPREAKDWREIKVRCGTLLLGELRRKFSLPQVSDLNDVLFAMFGVKVRYTKHRFKIKLFRLAAKKLDEANNVGANGEQERTYTNDQLLQALDLIDAPPNFLHHQWELYKSNLRTHVAKKTKHKRSPNRIEFFDLSYQSRDGSYINGMSKDFIERAREEMTRRELEISKSRPVDDEVRAEIADSVMMDLIGPDKPGQSLGYGTGVTKSKVTKLSLDSRRSRKESLVNQNRLLLEKLDSQSRRIESQNNQIKTMAKDLSDIRGELNVLTTAFKELYLAGASKDMFFQETSKDEEQQQQQQQQHQHNLNNLWQSLWQSSMQTPPGVQNEQVSQSSQGQATRQQQSVLKQQRQQGQATRQPTQLDSMGQQVNATNMQQNPLTGQQYGYSDMQQD